MSLLLLLLTMLLGSVMSLPLMYDINSQATECLYDSLEADEYLTMAMFISDGSKLIVDTSIEGPFADSSATTAKEIYAQLGKWRDRGDGVIRLSDHINLENIDHMDGDDDDYDYHGGDDDDRITRHREVVDKRMKEKHRVMKFLRAMSDGEPYERTVQVVKAGWYKVCVHAHSEVTVELEMRKSSEHGDPVDGHILSMESESEYEEELEVEANAANEEDLERSKDQIKNLIRTLSEIKDHLHHEGNRMSMHRAVNQHTHSRMVLNSLLETVLFIGVTGFQVHTIRKWFQGDPLLGR